MDSPRITAALALVDRIRAALDDAELPKATATHDATLVPSGARHGVVVVAAPSITFDTWQEITPVWELHVIAGPADNYLAAWATIDTIIEALHAAELNLAKAEPAAFGMLQGPPLPAYTLTLNPQ